MLTTIVSVATAVAGVAAVTALCALGKVDGQAALTLISVLVGGAGIHATRK